MHPLPLRQNVEGTQQCGLHARIVVSPPLISLGPQLLSARIELDYAPAPAGDPLRIASGGIGAALLGIPAQTTIQEDTPEHLRGKVFGLQNNLVNIALSLPMVLAGTLVGNFGLKPVLLLLALVVFGGVALERPWQKG